MRRHCCFSAAALVFLCLAVGGCTHLGRYPNATSDDTASDAHDIRQARAHAHFGAAIIREMDGDMEGALAEYAEAADADVENEELVLEVSRKLLQAKKPEKAMVLVERASARKNASGLIYSRLGLIYGQLGKYEQAVMVNRIALQRSPDSLPGYQNLFVLYMQHNKPADALNTLEAAANRKEVDGEFSLGVAEMYINYGLQRPAERANSNARAISMLERAKASGDMTPAGRVLMADLFSMAGGTEQGARLYNELLKDLPDSSGVRDRLRAKLADVYLRG